MAKKNGTRGETENNQINFFIYTSNVHILNESVTILYVCSI